MHARKYESVFAEVIFLSGISLDWISLQTKKILWCNLSFLPATVCYRDIRYDPLFVFHKQSFIKTAKPTITQSVLYDT